MRLEIAIRGLPDRLGGLILDLNQDVVEYPPDGMLVLLPQPGHVDPLPRGSDDDVVVEVHVRARHRAVLLKQAPGSEIPDVPVERRR